MVFKTQKEPTHDVQKATSISLAIIRERIKKNNSDDENTLEQDAQRGLSDFLKLDNESRQKLMLNVRKYQPMFSLPNDTDIIVRRNFYRLFNREGYEQISFNPKLVDDFLESKSLYREFQGKVAQVPMFSYVLARNVDYRNEDVPEMFVAIDRVNGEQISKLINQNSDPKLVSALEDVFVRAVDYIDEKIQAGGKFMIDIHLDQFMYGTTKRDPVQKIYFIDIENRFLESDEKRDNFRQVWQKEDRKYVDNFEKVYQSIFNMHIHAIKEIELKTGQRLSKLRGRLKLFIDKYEPKYYESAENRYRSNLESYKTQKQDLFE